MYMLDMKRIVELINTLGYKSYTFDYSIYTNYILGCYQWYKGKVPTFHTIKRYNGDTDVTIEKAKLHMAKRVSEDIASLTANENMIINIESPAENEFLLGNDNMTGLLGDNDFWASINKIMELTAALGTAGMEVMVESLIQVEDKLLVGPNSKIKIGRYDGLHILPLSWDNNGKIIEVAFLDEYMFRNEKYLELRLHVLNEEGNYVIVNKKCKINDINNTNNVNSFIYLDNSSVLSEFNTGSNIPWFTVFKMAQLNSYDINSPMGASAYGDAIDELKAIDDAFNTLCGEFRYSNKKIFYNKSLLQRDKNGKVVIPDDDENNKQVFYFTGDDLHSDADDGDNAVKDAIKEYNPEIRTGQLAEGIGLILDIISFKVGLGHGYYKFSADGGVQKTAKEVVSQNSDLYRNMSKMQLGIEKNIYEIVKALLYVSNYLFGTSYNLDCKMSVTFDTSLIEDKTAERERALKEVQLGLLTPDEYRAMYYPELGVKEGDDLTDDVKLNS